jgi:hypothetical protein
LGASDIHRNFHRATLAERRRAAALQNAGALFKAALLIEPANRAV